MVEPLVLHVEYGGIICGNIAELLTVWKEEQSCGIFNIYILLDGGPLVETWTATCLLCDQEEESIQHILVSCVFSREIWTKILLLCWTAGCCPPT